MVNTCEIKASSSLTVPVDTSFRRPPFPTRLSFKGCQPGVKSALLPFVPFLLPPISPPLLLRSPACPSFFHSSLLFPPPPPPSSLPPSDLGIPSIFCGCHFANTYHFSPFSPPSSLFLPPLSFFSFSSFLSFPFIPLSLPISPPGHLLFLNTNDL